MVTVKCDMCGLEFKKVPWEVHEHNFCCKEHFYKWNADRLRRYNRTENPLNKPGGVLETRLKARKRLCGTGEGKTYSKYLGRHTHRVIAEQKLGRPLKPGEIVHHIDGNKLNNDPNNIMIVSSQSEHCKLHGFGKIISGNKEKNKQENQ